MHQANHRDGSIGQQLAGLLEQREEKISLA
jgi:hypothetical protein